MANTDLLEFIPPLVSDELDAPAPKPKTANLREPSFPTLLHGGRLPNAKQFMGQKDTYTARQSLEGMSGSYIATASNGTPVFIKAYDRCRRKTALSCYTREISAITQLAPLGITPPILDTGRQKPLIVQPYTQGEDLDAVLDEQETITDDTSRAFILPIITAVSRAHNLGLVHRDLKPENIRYQEINGELDYGNPYVNDWGLATRGKETKHTMGTFPYMSPEQLQHNAQSDNRSDIYSLGIILHELMTGVTPYWNQSESEIMRTKERCPANPRKMEHTADKQLSAIVVRATHPDRNRRYQKLEEMAADLQRPPTVVVGGK